MGTPTLYATSQGHRFFDPFEEALPDTRQRLSRERLGEYISHARTIPWYRERLDGFDPKSDEPLRFVPTLTGDELKNHLPPFGRGLVVSKGDAYSVFQSGGTTGFPKTALFSSEEMDALDRINARGYFATGLMPTDRVANLFAAGSLYMTFIHINNMLQRYGCTSFPFAHQVDASFFKMIAERFDCNVIAGVGSIILKLLREVATMGPHDLKIERIYYGGEHMFDNDKAILKERFGTDIVLSPGYGTIDTWYIGYQCTQTPTGLFHAFDDQCFIEIVDETTGRACLPGEAGMLYVTPFPRRLTPIVRYRVGDLARWTGRSCPCGRTTPLFELLGRGDDMLRIGYHTIDYKQVQECLASFGSEVGAFQIERQRRETRDQLILRAETEAPDSHHEALASRLTKAILESRPLLAASIDEGLVWPIAVELVSPRSLPTNPRTGKLLRVIDVR